MKEKISLTKTSEFISTSAPSVGESVSIDTKGPEAKVEMGIFGSEAIITLSSFLFSSSKDGVLVLWRTVCCHYSILERKA